MHIPALALPTRGDPDRYLGTDRFRVIVGGRSTDGRYSLMEWVTPPGPLGAAHRHGNYEEAFYLVEGNVVFELGDERAKVVAQPGTWVRVPAGSRHTFQAQGGEARMLVVFTPGGMEELFEAFSDDTSEAAGSATSRIALNGAQFVKSAREDDATEYEFAG
jgi:quercetin dioxygenase-like cupin family protein